MKTTSTKLAILLFPILCVACATTSQTQLNQTLQHYIGQSSDQVQNQLNLNSMGYKVLGAPVHPPEKLTYTLLRNMPIPMRTPTLEPVSVWGRPFRHLPAVAWILKWNAKLSSDCMMILWNLFTTSAKRVNGCVMLSRLHTVYLKLLETYSNERSDIQY